MNKHAAIAITLFLLLVDVWAYRYFSSKRDDLLVSSRQLRKTHTLAKTVVAHKRNLLRPNLFSRYPECRLIHELHTKISCTLSPKRFAQLQRLFTKEARIFSMDIEKKSKKIHFTMEFGDE